MTASPVFLVFSLGPVQGFIAQSRRTADGWMGSYILSYLIGRAMEAVDSLGEIREPSRSSPMYEAIKGSAPADFDSTIAALPNTLLVGVADAAAAVAAGEAAERAVREFWRDRIADSIWTALPATLRQAGKARDVWNAQVRQHWEIYWVCGATPAEAYQNLAARKGVRSFEPWAEAGDRCTVCSQRAPLFDDGKLTPGRTVQAAARESWRAWAPQFLNLPEVPATLLKDNGSERLCAICVIKRLTPWIDNPINTLLTANAGGDRVRAGQLASFPSTATMATVLSRCRLVEEAAANDALRRALEDYRAKLQSALKARPDAPLKEPELTSPRMELERFTAWKECAQRIPGSWPAGRDFLRLDGDFYLFGESVINESGLSADPKTPDGQKTRDADQAYRTLQDLAKEAEVPPPPIYWALLAMDGDKMGEFLRLVDASPMPGAAGEVSEELSEFVTHVRTIVEDHNGRTIFAGGDDVLAMFPVTTVMGAAENLRVNFRDRFRTWWIGHSRPPSIPEDKLPTLSGAIILAHHQAPLSRVISKAQEVLKTWAKARAGRNALAVQRYLRGGEGETFAAKWEDDPGTGSGATLVQRLRATIGLLDKRELASRSLYNIRRFDWLLGPAGTAPGNGFAFSTEEHRTAFLTALLGKSRLEPASDTTSLAARVSQLLGLCDGATWAAHGTRDAGTPLTTEALVLARFIAGEGREER